MNAIHEFQSRGKEYKVAGTAEGGRFRLLARSPTSGFFETVAYSDQESIQADMLAELARLATQKAENLPDGSREFEHGGKRWKIGVEGQGAFIARETRDGWRMTNFEYSLTPPYYVIGREFAALGREQGRTEAMREKVNILPGAKAIIEWKDARIAAIEDERDRARDDARDTFRDLNAARERIATLERDCDTWRDGCAVDQRDLAAARERIADLEAQLAAKHADYLAACLGLPKSWRRGYKAAGARIAELDQREEDSRAEVADLSRRLEEWRQQAIQREKERDANRREANAAWASYRKERSRAEEEKARTAILEGELVAAKTAAAGRARTEGAPLAMCATFDPSIAGTYEPHARLYIQRGDSVFSLREGLDREGLEWIKLPPLPPIDPAKAGAEEREPAPPALARHDWRTHRGHVSCERCGAPFSEVRKDQACGAQP